MKWRESSSKFKRRRRRKRRFTPKCLHERHFWCCSYWPTHQAAVRERQLQMFSVATRFWGVRNYLKILIIFLHCNTWADTHLCSVKDQEVLCRCPWRHHFQTMCVYQRVLFIMTPLCTTLQNCYSPCRNTRNKPRWDPLAMLLFICNVSYCSWLWQLTSTFRY